MWPAAIARKKDRRESCVEVGRSRKMRKVVTADRRSLDDGIVTLWL